MKTIPYEPLQGPESIQQISILDARVIRARFDEFRELRDGWLDGKGCAPAHSGLDWIAQAFEQSYPDDLPLPYLYPTSEGGVQAEWSLHDCEISLEIDLHERVGEWHDLNMNTHVENSRSLNLDQPQEWEWIADQIHRFAGEAA